MFQLYDKVSAKLSELLNSISDNYGVTLGAEENAVYTRGKLFYDDKQDVSAEIRFYDNTLDVSIASASIKNTNLIQSINTFLEMDGMIENLDTKIRLEEREGVYGFYLVFNSINININNLMDRIIKNAILVLIEVLKKQSEEL